MFREAMLYESIDGKMVHCMLCNHDCQIATSKFGVCGVRQNIKGKLFTYAYGEVVAAHIDPIEKKPLYHFLPGTRSFSIAAAGCNFKCGFCQNWQISQISKRTNPELTGYVLPPEEIIRKALDEGCRSISYTYTEPTIFFEYAYDTARLAKEKGLLNVFVTNGFMTTRAIETIQPYLDGCNVDLKSFSETFYKSVCHGALAPVLGIDPGHEPSWNLGGSDHPHHPQIKRQQGGAHKDRAVPCGGRPWHPVAHQPVSPRLPV